MRDQRSYYVCAENAAYRSDFHHRRHHKLRRRITDPILAISDSMHRFAMNSSVKPEPLGIHSEDEIGKIASSYEKMTEEISTYISNIETLTRDKVQNDIQLDIARRIQNGLVPESGLCVHRGYPGREAGPAGL